MVMDENKIVLNTVERGAIKLHIFRPSGRAIWTVVGRDREYWVDPDLDFCSCKGYYYETLSTCNPCYHLKSAKLARKNRKFVEIKFQDVEYLGFIRALLYDATLG